MTFPFADLELARRLERAEGMANRNFVEARARVQPEVGACWMEAGGALAMFDGVGSPLTQTFGLGLFERPAVEHLEAIEAFFRSRGSAVHHETAPLADPALVALLASRGYRPIEYTSVLYQPLGGQIRGQTPGPSRGLTPDLSPRDTSCVRVFDVGTVDEVRYAEAAVEGWSDNPDLTSFLRDTGKVQAQAVGFRRFLAEIDGKAIATGALFTHGDVALLAGASTIPSGRRQGAQLALLEARLAAASAASCRVAMMGAAPGSGSQRNAERQGFRIAYTRVKWAAPASTSSFSG